MSSVKYFNLFYVLSIPIASPLAIGEKVVAADVTPISIRSVYLDLPHQSLAASLLNISDVTEISIFLDPNELDGYISRPIVGFYSIHTALKHVLTDTPFSYQYNIATNSAKVYRKKTQNNAKQRDYGNWYSEEEIIVTASGYKTPIELAPSTASVILAKDIERSGAKDLNEALQLIPGLHVSISSLSRLDFIFSIRGIHTAFNPHVLLLLNGRPIQFSFQGRPTLFHYPTNYIARIEVIRGPGSAIYGADAYSGVINVITKEETDSDVATIGLKRGSFNFIELWHSGALQKNEWQINYNATFQKSDGDTQRTINTDFQSTLDQLFSTTASQAPGALATHYEIFNGHISLRNNTWEASLWNWSLRDAGVGAGAAQALDPQGNNDGDLFLLDTNYHFFQSEDWENNIRASYQHYDTLAKFNLLPEGAQVPLGEDGNINFAPSNNIFTFTDGLIGEPGGTTTDTMVDLISQFSGWENHILRAAIGWRKQKLDTREKKNFGPGVINGENLIISGELTDVSNSPFVFVQDTKRTIQYVSLQDEWNLPSNVTLVSGVRHDKYSDFGATTNPRLALAWKPHMNTSLKLTYGKAFRAPSFSEQYLRHNPISIGNQNLKPEQIDTYEASFYVNTSDHFSASLNLFKYRAKRLIEFTVDENATTRTAQNVGQQFGRGFEFETKWTLTESLSITGTLSKQDARRGSSDEKVPDTPRRLASLSLNWQPIKKWYFTTNINHVGDRIREHSDPRKPIDDYTLTTMKLGHKGDQFDISFGIRNITNADAREPSSGFITEDYPLESRSYWAEVRYTFR